MIRPFGWYEVRGYGKIAGGRSGGGSWSEAMIGGKVNGEEAGRNSKKSSMKVEMFGGDELEVGIVEVEVIVELEG